jgi:hypothetical protein
MLLMGSRGSKRTDADFRSGAIREIGPARKYASHDPKFAPAMGNEMARDGTRLALFIDGANAHATAKALGFDIDYKRLLRELQSRGTLVRAFCYTAIFEDQEYSSIRPLIDWLNYNGFTVVTKPAKELDDGEGRRKFKRSIRVELAVDALTGMTTCGCYSQPEDTEMITSVVDAVDGSSTGTSVPRIWALLRLPRFRGASHADDDDNRFRYRQVGFPGSRR